MDKWRTDLGPLAPFVDDTVRDLCVDGSGRVWVDRGHGFLDVGIALDPRTVRRIGVSLVESGGGRVDDARPMGDAALPGQIRAHLVLPPVARAGPLLSLRFPAVHRITFDQFTPVDGAKLEVLAVETTLIGGVTGSGKSTLLTAVIDAMHDARRVVIAEDITEINPSHPHTVHLTTRVANQDGGGRIELAELVRESLRMRPDSLVVGEIRGAEIRDFLAAVTAGHHGLSTIHANGLDEIATRVTTLAMLAGIPRNAIAPLVTSAVRRVALCERTDIGVTVAIGRLENVAGELRVATP
ncbi:MAG: ATPase, T2SS/T4P/T4SS family [Microbacteriaceae bacterium]